MDDELDGIAAGLSKCITSDGQSTISADIPWNNRKITGLGDATGAAHAMNRQTSDARYVRNPEDLSAETSVDSADIWSFFDDSASANKGITHANLLKVIARAVIPIGIQAPYAGSTAPDGWLLCYGQAISRSTYADLFTAIGTTFGSGNGSTTFNLPDDRGRADVGKDNMGGSSANRLTDLTNGLNGDTLGDTGGTETNTLLRANLPNDTITTTTDGNHVHAYNRTLFDSSSGFQGGNTSGFYLDPTNTTQAGSHTHTIALNGGVTQTTVNNVQPSIVKNKIIFTGVFS